MKLPRPKSEVAPDISGATSDLRRGNVTGVAGRREEVESAGRERGGAAGGREKAESAGREGSGGRRASNRERVDATSWLMVDIGTS